MTSQQTTDGITLGSISYLQGNRRQMTDADGKVTTTSYQAFDTPEYTNPTQVAAPENQTTTINRDVFGKILSVSQGSAPPVVRTYVYDGYQRLCRRFDPEAGNTLWGYDLASQMVWQAKGQSSSTCTATAPAGATLFSYDTRGRKTLDDYPGTADDVAYGYDAAGNPTSVVNPVASWTYAYNKRNLPETEQAQIDGHTYLIDPTYNSLGQPANLTYPDTLSIAYAPNAFGEPTQLTASCCGGAALGVYASGIQHYPNGVISSYSLGNGLIYSQGLDNRQRLNLQATKSGTTVIQQFGYSYSNAGDLKTITDPTGVDSANLGYDGLHRLISASGVWGGYTYGYGDQNNLVSRSGTNPLAYGYDGNNRLTSISSPAPPPPPPPPPPAPAPSPKPGPCGIQACPPTSSPSSSAATPTNGTRSYSYTAQGAMTGDGLRSFTLNSRDQITAIAGMATYAYDGNGRRIKTTQADGTVEYAIYDLSDNLAYVDHPGTGLHSAYVKLQGQSLAEVTNGTPTYLHPDLLGSPRMATGTGQQVLWREHFDPYGQKLNGVNEKVGYTGHAYDPESGLTYAGARLYDPAVGRFLSVDPVGFTGNPFSFNRYAYVNNNPYGGTDPTGMVALTESDYKKLSTDQVSFSGSGEFKVEGRQQAGDSAASSTAGGTSGGNTGGSGGGTNSGSTFDSNNGRAEQSFPDAILPVGRVVRLLSSIVENLFGSSVATEQTVESLTDILMPGGKAPGKAGSTEETRVLNGGIKAAQDFFDSVAEGALPINKPTYPGTMVRAGPEIPHSDIGGFSAL